MCKQHVTQYVPKGYGCEARIMTCGDTSIHGTRLTCESCQKNPTIMQAIEDRQASMEDDNQWLASAGWGEM